MQNLSNLAVNGIHTAPVTLHWCQS